MSAFPRTYAGRHRTPATANRTTRALVGVTAAGAVVAAPLVMASPAQAATGRIWDRLAQCESGGNWSINTGNGFYGGLQVPPSPSARFRRGAHGRRAEPPARPHQIPRPGGGPA